MNTAKIPQPFLPSKEPVQRILEFSQVCLFASDSPVLMSYFNSEKIHIVLFLFQVTFPFT